MSGTGTHRGFAFVDFLTKQDAKVRSVKEKSETECCLNAFLYFWWAGACSSLRFIFGFFYFSVLQRAFESLCSSTHLYGRRLVLEWAEDEDSVDALRKRTAEHFHGSILF